MKRRVLAVVCALGSAGLLMGAARQGAWLRRVPATAKVQVNPLTRDAMAREHASAGGKQLYRDHCAQCHGAAGLGIGSRPEILSDRVAGASDGDLFWLMTNGDPYHGMPAWQMLPAAQRWQLVAYVKQLNREDESTADGTAVTHLDAGIEPAQSNLKRTK